MFRSKEKFSVVICSVSYNDVLQHTLPISRGFFDDIVVVTSKTDDECVEICKKNNVRYIQSDIFYRNGYKFNKAAGLNLGLESIQSDWYLSLDADILLVDGFQKEKLEQDCLYSMRRFDCTGSWQLKWINLVGIHALKELDCSWSKNGNKIPIGYFTMWRGKKYFAQNRNAADYDLEFAYRWPENKWRFMNEKCLHLTSKAREEDYSLNWNGRVSNKWE